MNNCSKPLLLKGYVNDKSSILNTKQIELLTKKFIELEKKIGSQIVILTIDTYKGKDINDFSRKMIKKWKLGRLHYHDAVLITISTKNREISIEATIGLRKIITNEISQDIIDKYFIPNFKENKFFTGLNYGTDKIIELINKNKSKIKKLNIVHDFLFIRWTDSAYKERKPLYEQFNLE